MSSNIYRAHPPPAQQLIPAELYEWYHKGTYNSPLVFCGRKKNKNESTRRGEMLQCVLRSNLRLLLDFV